MTPHKKPNTKIRFVNNIDVSPFLRRSLPTIEVNSVTEWTGEAVDSENGNSINVANESARNRKYINSCTMEQ
jgi:hypothetical protein